MTKNILGWAFCIILFGLVFSRFFFGDAVLMSTDAAISNSNLDFETVLQRVFPTWVDDRLLGSPGGRGTQVAHLLKLLVNGVAWNNMVYSLACLLASLMLLLKFRRVSPWAAVLGAVTAFWVGTNFTTIIGGHNFKPYVTLFFVCSLLPVAGVAAGSIFSALIWGGCVGLMFAQQPDVALFYALCSGCYLLFSLWKVQGFKPVKWLKVMLPAAALAFLFAGGPLLNGYKVAVKGAAQMQEQEQNPEAKWNYITQWSLPPEDTIAFVAPGYKGWRSNEPEGPYWGRCGQSPEWKESGQGFRNFKLDDYYYGIIPILFALFALVSWRRSKHRAEILFWGGATFLTLLLAFGKYFPLYALFFKLPVVSAVRSPVKFLQVFQVSLAILSVYGMHALFSSHSDSAEDRSLVRRFFWGCCAGLGIILLAALSHAMGHSRDITGFVAEGWPKQVAETIVSNRISALWYAAFMAAVMAAAFGLFAFSKFEKILRHRTWLAFALVVLVAADAVKYSKHYVSEMPRSYIEANALTDFLKADLGEQRVAFLSQQGINNIWITYLMPYNRIPCFNFSDMPRMPVDYQAFLSSGQRDPLNMWRSSAVKYLLGPVQAEQQLVAMNCKKVFVYGLSDAGNNEFKVVPHPSGSFAVYELGGTMPRFALFAGSKKGSDDEALAKIADFSKVVLAEDSLLPELDGTGQTGSVEVLSYRAGKVKLRVTTDKPAILRAADRYDADWKATVDGKKADVGRVDFICTGVAVPAGEHEVVLRYAPGRLYFYMQVVGLIVLIAAMILAFRNRKKDHVED